MYTFTMSVQRSPYASALTHLTRDCCLRLHNTFGIGKTSMDFSLNFLCANLGAVRRIKRQSCSLTHLHFDLYHCYTFHLYAPSIRHPSIILDRPELTKKLSMFCFSFCRHPAIPPASLSAWRSRRTLRFRVIWSRLSVISSIELLARVSMRDD